VKSWSNGSGRLLAVLFPQGEVHSLSPRLRDVAVSCWMTNFRRICWSSDQEHIAARFEEYQRVMAHWRNVLPVEVLVVDYAKTVADLEGVSRRLVRFCAWWNACVQARAVGMLAPEQRCVKSR
jgi:hypothetical protein